MLAHSVLITVAGLFLAAHTAYALDPDRAMSQYVHDGWSGDQGFPKGPVYAIAQTTDGYLWIGTDAGLVRFDGWNFRLIRDESGAFTFGSVLGLASDGDGCLWLRAQDLTALRYCHGVFDRPSPNNDLSRRVEAMSRAYKGNFVVWRAQDGVLRISGAKVERLAPAAELPPSPIISLALSPGGDIWMGTRDGGLYRNSAGKTLSIRSGLPDLKVNCLLPVGDHELWVGTDDGVVRWNGSELVPSGLTGSLRHLQALAMTGDGDGNVWIGTDSHGLLRLNSHGVAQIGFTDTASRQAVTALFEDREGDLWVGHPDGIERLRDSAFVTYSAPEGLPTDGSNPVYVDSENRVWFPPVTGGLWWIRSDQRGQVTNDGLNHDVVYSIDGAPGELWLGRQHGGLTALRFDRESILAKTYTHAEGLAQDSVYSVYHARDGSVWAGTLSAGVSVLRDGKFTNYTVTNGLASNTVAAILQTRDGTLWFATPSGLSSWSKDHWVTYRSDSGLPSENVNCLLEDSAGVLWAGTASGIAFRRSKGFEAPLAAQPALHEQVFGLAEDRFGGLWLATINHVLRVDRAKLLDGTLTEADVRTFGLGDGLRGLEGVKRHKSVITDSDGRVWLSLNRGISVVDPARLTRNSVPAIAHIENVVADGAPIGILKAARIPGGRQRVTFGFTGINLSAPDRVRYRYWLEGFDRGWNDPTAAREAIYTNLPPGHYHFWLLASNPDVGSGTSQDSLAFEVDPLVWQTLWFRLSVVVVCLALILAVYRLRLRQLTRQISVRFEERLAERTRIAQELHDTLLQGFLSASMQVHVATDRLPESSEARPTLKRALELMRQVIEEGRNTVRGLRSSRSTSLGLEQAFSQIQGEMTPDQETGPGIDFRVIVDGEQRPLHPVLRDEVYRIGREALINAFRHAHARSIELELRYSPQRLSMFVRDDGRGIDPKVLEAGREGHWGLSGMRERADRIGAGLHLRSSASAGTEIELSVPGKVAYPGQQDRRFKWFGKRRRGTAPDPAPSQNGSAQ